MIATTVDFCCKFDVFDFQFLFDLKNFDSVNYENSPNLRIES